MQIDPAQEMVVAHRSGPACVSAAPGSGKTSTLVRHVLSLLDDGVLPERILVITFSRSAARTFRSRLASTTAAVPVRTFHSEAIHILRSPPSSRPLDRLLSDSAQASLWAEVIGPRTRFCPSAIGPLRDVLNPELVSTTVERVRLAGKDPTRDPTLPPVFRSAASAYKAAKRHRRVVDYTDLVTLACTTLVRNPAVLEAHSPDYLVVDEGQDTNATQMRLVQLLGTRAQSLLVVGDPNQAIYGFQGADPSALTHFSKRFPGATTYRLPLTYRCAPAIAATANALMEPCSVSPIVPTRTIRGLVGTVMHAEADFESDWVAEQAKNLLKMEPAVTVLVITRTNLDLEAPAASLLASGIPFTRLGGATGFWGLPEISGLLDMLKLAADPSDMVAACRLATWPPLPRANYAPAIRAILAHGGPPAGYVTLAESYAGGLRTKHLITPALRSTARTRPRDLIAGVVESGVWRKLVPPGYSHDRIGSNLGKLNAIAKRASSIESLLSMASFEKPPEDDEKAERITLTTAHGAKGTEADVVLILGTEMGRFPHAKSLDDASREEERRLLYVATTRARSLCVMSACVKRDGRPQTVSPFLADIEATLHLPRLTGNLKDWMTWARQQLAVDDPVAVSA